MPTKTGDLASRMAAPAGDRPHIVVVYENEGVVVKASGGRAEMSEMFLLLQLNILEMFKEGPSTPIRPHGTQLS